MRSAASWSSTPWNAVRTEPRPCWVGLAELYLTQQRWAEMEEVLAHVAAWEAEATRRISLLVQGAADQEYDVDSFNAAAVEAIGDQQLGQVCAGLEKTHARLVTLLAGLGEAAFAPGGAAHEWVTALTRHSRVHARELDGGGLHERGRVRVVV